MQLACTELSTVVSIISISVETGFSVERIRRYLNKRDVRPVKGGRICNCNMYDCRMIRDAFADVKSNNFD